MPGFRREHTKTYSTGGSRLRAPRAEHRLAGERAYCLRRSPRGACRYRAAGSRQTEASQILVNSGRYNYMVFPPMHRDSLPARTSSRRSMVRILRDGFVVALLNPRPRCSSRVPAQFIDPRVGGVAKRLFGGASSRSPRAPTRPTCWPRVRPRGDRRVRALRPLTDGRGLRRARRVHRLQRPSRDDARAWARPRRIAKK